MRQLLRRWLGIEPCDRAKLTLLPDKAILGLPKDTDEETAYRVARHVADYINDKVNVVVFPFPVDVEDKR